MKLLAWALGVAPFLLACAGCSGTPDATSGNDGGAPPDGGAVASDAGAADSATVADSATLPGVGESCQSPPGCAEGAFCNSDPACTGASCPFTCRASCEGSGMCPGGSWCEPEPFTHQSFCAPRAAAGQPCKQLFVEPRGTTNTCIDGTWCDTSAGLPGTCAPQFGADAACTANGVPYECVDGYACDQTSSDVTRKCRPLAKAGGACINSDDCEPSLYCDEPDLHKSYTWTCKPRIAKGGACNAQSSSMCEYPTTCQFASKGQCTTWVDCGSSMDCCAGADGKGTCTSSPGCAPPQGTCQ